MTDPIAYVSTWRIKEGRFEDYRRFFDGLVKVVDKNEPRVSAFLTFVNDDLSEITNVHVFPDRETLDRHMKVLDEKMSVLPSDLTAVTRNLEPVGVQVYGRPSGAAAALDKGLMDIGVPFETKQRFLGGFTRQP